MIKPQHVAIVMDGNGRWAKQRGFLRLAGHKAGVDSLRKTIKTAAENQVSVLSVFAFSTENWSRPKAEVSGLMSLFLSALKSEVKTLHENNIRLRIVGDRSRFSTKIQAQIEKSENLTAENTGMTLVIAANYGGRWDICQAAYRFAQAVKKNEVKDELIDEDGFSKYLSLSDLPEPDLLIRTSGEKRVSNFFLWQLAYSELYFTDTLWPDFDEQAFQEALDVFAKRDRRFGKTKIDVSAN